MDAAFADQQLADYVASQRQELEAHHRHHPLDVSEMRAGGAERARLRARGPELAAVRDVCVGAVAARLALDYRLAPEHPWPAAVDDVADALRWIAGSPSELGPVRRLAAAGDSAGGTLATLACLRLRDEQALALPDLQVLICPNTDLTGSCPSMRENAYGFGLSAEAVRFFNAQWVPDQTMWADPRVSPLHASDLSGLPAAVIVTAEHDPLRDEGEAYAAALEQAGVDVELRREQGLIHGFALMDEVSPACAAAAERLAADIRRRLRQPGSS